MRAATDNEAQGAGDLAGGLLITGSGVLERTVVEAVRLEDGLTVWWYDRRLRFDDVVCRDGKVFIISCGRARDRRGGFTEVVALRAGDGLPLWRVDRERLRGRMARMRPGWGLRVLWQTSSPSAAWWAMREFELAGLPGYTNLAVGDDVVLASAGSIVFAFSARTGRFRWCSPKWLGGDRRLIAARGNTVYIRGARNALDALNARTGKVRWSSDKQFSVGSLAANDTHVYISAHSSRGPFLASLSALDGTHELTRSLADGEVLAGLTDDGTAYLMRESRLCAVRLADGEEMWHGAPLPDISKDDGASSSSSVRVAAGEQVVFYGYTSFWGESHAMIVGGLDARTGVALWEWRSPEQPRRQNSLDLVAARGKVYVIASAGIFALNGVNGQLLWRTPGGVTITGVAVCAGGVKPA